jgi:hypothetical protein
LVTSIHKKPIIVNKECQTLARRGTLLLIDYGGWAACKDDLSWTGEILRVVPGPEASWLRDPNMAVGFGAIDF